MEDVREARSLPLFASSGKESESAPPIASTIDALANPDQDKIRNETSHRNHEAINRLREHEADSPKHG